jgi:hypothetical protein
MLPKEKGQKHPVRDTKGQFGSRKVSYRAESEKESYVKEDKVILEERDSLRLEEDIRCGKHLQMRILLVMYLSTSSLMGF